MEIQTQKENRLIGHKITPEGICEVFYNDADKKETVEEFRSEPLKELHPKFRDKHRKAFFAICCVIDHFSEIKRELPILREEAVENLEIEKNVLKDLEKFELVESVMLPVTSKDGKSKGGRLAYVLTSQGRSLKKTIQEAMIAQGESGQSG